MNFSFQVISCGRRLGCLLSALWLTVAAHAQPPDGAVPVQIRAVLHDPVHPAAELYLTDASGAAVKVNFVAGGFSEVYSTVAVNGALTLYNSPGIDPKNPAANVAATVTVPPDTKRAMVIVVPAPTDAKPPYRMVLINDSPTAFPKGESRVLNLVPVEMAIAAGEHKLPVRVGQITPVPPVKKVNEFNIAQTNFHYKNGDSWVVFTERQLQYLDAYRRVFIIHTTPGSAEPFVTTILDTAPAVLPQPPRKGK